MAYTCGRKIWIARLNHSAAAALDCASAASSDLGRNGSTFAEPSFCASRSWPTRRRYGALRLRGISSKNACISVAISTNSGLGGGKPSSARGTGIQDAHAVEPRGNPPGECVSGPFPFKLNVALTTLCRTATTQVRDGEAWA